MFYGAGPVSKRVKYSNPKVTDIIATTRRERDSKKRDAYYRELSRVCSSL